MRPWKTGDVVVLKSGGSAMTVDDVRPDGAVRCLWFEGSTLHRDLFAADMLRQA